MGNSKGTTPLGVDSVTKQKMVSARNKSKKNKNKNRPIKNPNPQVEWYFDHLRPCFNYQRCDDDVLLALYFVC